MKKKQPYNIKAKNSTVIIIGDNNDKGLTSQVERLTLRVNELSEQIKIKDNLISKLDKKLKSYEARDENNNG